MRISDWSSDVCSSDLTGGYRPHESPLSIPIPLILLSVGAVAAGYTFQNYFIAPDAGETFWKGALYHSEHLMHAMHEVPVWVKLGPTIVMLIGLYVAWLAYIRKTDIPAHTAIGRAHVLTPVTNAQLVCRLLLENKNRQTHT